MFEIKTKPNQDQKIADFLLSLFMRTNEACNIPQASLTGIVFLHMRTENNDNYMKVQGNVLFSPNEHLTTITANLKYSEKGFS